MLENKISLCGISSSNITLPKNKVTVLSKLNYRLILRSLEKKTTGVEITLSTDNSSEPLSDLESMDEDVSPPSVPKNLL